ncbi:unannotated protein [freshwater metagenome]|uniref:Unannotated protein n=1 Tax=freshwater metagenome TaxID=449393 RepID=A0A6J7DIN2_9ZZZZ|nr:hypothetical protein [Actinomycetota bacterium]
MSSNSYIAGSCNIGKGEIRRRQIVALIGLVLSILAILGFIATSAPAASRISIFAPFAVTFIGWVQSRKKFCLAYGFMGTFNFGKLGDLSRVADPVSKSADRKTALKILAEALLYAAIATAVVAAIPL